MPILKTFEPRRSPTDKDGDPSVIAKKATVSSGSDVMTERRANPTDVSPRPVISIRPSMAFITYREVNASTAKELIRMIMEKPISENFRTSTFFLRPYLRLMGLCEITSCLVIG